MKKLAARVLLFALTLTAFSLFAEEYSFKVTNKTDTTIKKIMVSEDGKNYGYFDIGAGIKPGKTVTLVWDSSTDGESCEQWVKAIYADGSESEPAKFDFCEADVISSSSNAQRPTRLMSADSRMNVPARPCTTRSMARPSRSEVVQNDGMRRTKMGKSGFASTMNAL